MSGGIPAWAVKGAKCVCVDDRNGAMGEPCPFKRGEVCTVAGTNNHGLFVVEHEFIWLGRSLPFGFDRFRPVKTIEDDISEHFEILLHQPVSSKEPAL